MRWIRDEQALSNSKSDVIEHVLLDLSGRMWLLVFIYRVIQLAHMILLLCVGVSTIDMTGIAAFREILRILEAKSIKVTSNN